MLLIEKLKLDQLEARKARNAKKASLLTTLVSEAAMPGLNDGHRSSTDAEVIRVIKRFLDGVTTNIDALKAASGDADRIAALEEEAEILKSYTPSTLDDDELTAIIRGHISECNDFGLPVKLGNVMTFLRNSYGGRYDGVTAKNIAVSQISL